MEVSKKFLGVFNVLCEIPSDDSCLIFCSRETRTMVQLFPSQASDATALSDSMEEREAGLDDGPSGESSHVLTALQLALNPSAAVYQGYETYIEDGLICLRHKIRNIEKKKVASCSSDLYDACRLPNPCVPYLLLNNVSTFTLCSSGWKATRRG